MSHEVVIGFTWSLLCWLIGFWSCKDREKRFCQALEGNYHQQSMLPILVPNPINSRDSYLALWRNVAVWRSWQNGFSGVCEVQARDRVKHASQNTSCKNIVLPLWQFTGSCWETPGHHWPTYQCALGELAALVRRPWPQLAMQWLPKGWKRKRGKWGKCFVSSCEGSSGAPRILRRHVAGTLGTAVAAKTVLIVAK